jgi:hypothetical protein
VKLTWADIEEHRAAATPAQWRRMEAYFLHGKPISQIAREDGLLIDKTPRKRISVQLALGRGCAALINAMLQRPVRVVDTNDLAEPAQTAGGNVPPIAEPPPRKKPKNNNRGWTLSKRRLKPPGERASESSLPAAASSTITAIAEPLAPGEPEVRPIELSGQMSAEPEGVLALAIKNALAAQSKVPRA